jgi:hypothetical protein
MDDLRFAPKASVGKRCYTLAAVAPVGFPAFMRALLVFSCAAFIASVSCAEEKIWHVKAIHPEGKLLDVKAIDKQGKTHSVKAIETDGNVHVLDIKALVDGKRLPIKIIVSDDKYAPLKAIGENGAVIDIKAITAEGQKLDVKGVKRSGSIIHIKAIAADGTFYGVKALSPEGRVYDVKGIKMSPGPEETKVNGVSVAAHIKALPQAPETVK